MTTEELREAAQRGLDKIDVKVGDHKVFLDDIPDFHYGTYYSVEENTIYRTTVGERGYHKKEALDSLEDALFQIYYCVTSQVAAKYAIKHHDDGSGLDWRRTMHAKQLELLKQLGESYYLQGQKHIEGALGVWPYLDRQPSLFWKFRKWIRTLWK